MPSGTPFSAQVAIAPKIERHKDGPRPMRAEIEATARALQTDIRGVARHLEISVGSLRSWNVRGGPAYARLALAALVSRLDPDKVFDQKLEITPASDGDNRR